MKKDKNTYKELLNSASDMGDMLYWHYFCDSAYLDVSEHIYSYLDMDSIADCSEKNRQDLFNGFINSIFINEREKIRSIVFGQFSEPEGECFYHTYLGNEIRYHKCRYLYIKEGNETVVIGITQDITQMKKQEERNIKIIEAIPDFIFIFDSNFFIVDILKSDDIKLLHPVDYLIGIDGRNVYSKETSKLFIDSIHDCLENKIMREIEYSLDIGDGSLYYYQARMVPFEEDKVMALIHDIGERVKYTEELIQAKKRAERADKMKSTFLANMSHEIRTPLNAIVGFSEILLSAENAEEKESYAEIIRRNNDLLLQLIDDILDLSRLESGKAELHYTIVDMNLMVKEIFSVYKGKVKPEVEVRMEVPEESIMQFTDRNRLTQVLFNFMSNAIKNTDKGTITLQLSLEGSFIRISVQDTGCGIKVERLPDIFERFTKLNDFVQGTGLGLTICNSIAQKLEGRIEVSSAYGRGSVFSIVIPLKKLENLKPKLEVTNSLLPENIPAELSKTILVAEDVDVNFLLVKTILKKDYTILWAKNGKEAIDKFKEEVPDLILMDIKMPIMDGIEATQEIRSMSKSIPIIALTAHAFSEEKQAALDAGCNDVILKPFNHKVLKDVIKKQLS